MSGTIAVIQARMTSTRLPGKSLMPLAGRPMFAHVVDRVRRIPGIDAVWLATTDDGSEAPLAALADALGVPVYRGSVTDVLSRYAAVARATGAHTVMRITADCPLLDPAVSGAVLALFASDPACDYATNSLGRTFPRGLDTEVMTAAALAEADREATDPLDREHVTRFFYTHPERFRIRQQHHAPNLGHLRWTVDTPEDLAFAERVHEALAARGLDTAMASTLAVLDAEPALSRLNAHVQQTRVV